MDILTHNPLHLCVHMYVYNGYNEGLALCVLWINLTHVYIAIMNVLCWLLNRISPHKIVVNTKVHHMFTPCNSG